MKWPKRIFAGLLALIITYLGAALFGSIFPANQFWKSPDDGIELFIETNGLHTGIIIPIQSDVHDWSVLIRPEHLDDPTVYGSHVLVGWGHEGVYRNAEHWRDLRLKDAASAVFGSNDVLLHVYHLKYPQTYPHYRRSFKVSEAEYRLIVEAINDRFVLDETGQSIPSKGYGKYDLFYRSQGHYNAFYTCNSWTGDVLRQAGIRTGIWTPFQGGVMRWFLEAETDN
ncbi:TIGR02117 family protein [Parasphingorhabdus cellanae]|uniref:TIGR02117 family protein n=1 Tax=Parasphingorhabdus cellanae TaxID=2806553 RepID=A0ABX7T884_9SPHN|nr:TIGR02117 family protein [Parasphingorhabdus cellanae]QTD56654.1 TIGR02117 family protein [Parasphingorhabdus cellanae]